MAKKVSKFFRIGVEGDTCDGRVISAQDIQEMAETFDPRVYGCRINLEHLRGILPDGIFKRYGDVVELKAEKIDDDSALKGKWALFAKITPTDDLIAMNKAAQKVYTSMEIQPNFANTGKCYLVGLAVTDDPASLGTEYLEFCRTAKHNPLNRFKLSPENLISVATPVELEFEDLPETVFTALTEKVKSIFGRKQASDDARLNDVHEAVADALMLPLNAFNKLRSGIDWVLEKLGVINKESDTLDQTAARTHAATYGTGGYIPATSSYAGYQAYQPVTAPAGRSYVDQSKNEYHISLTGGTAPGTQLDRQLQDALEKYERDKRARARASMMHDG